MAGPSHVVRAGTVFGTVAVSHGSFCDEAGWSSVWADEFDGAALDDASWAKRVGPPGNSLTRDATATAESVWLEEGALVIKTDGQWDGSSWQNLTSGGVEGRGKRSWRAAGTPTRVCVSAKLPGGGNDARGRGIWPAHWMMPDADACWPCAGEIDIMEMINGDGWLHGTYHWSRTNTSGDDQQTQSTLAMPGTIPFGDGDWGNTWHEYAAEYDGSKISFALDGKVYKTVTEESLSLPGFQKAKIFDVPYYVILNTAIGGAWPKHPDSHTVLPTHHYVDYVRVATPASPSVTV